MKLLKFIFLFLSLFSLISCVSTLPINQQNKNNDSLIEVDSIQESKVSGQILSNKTMLNDDKRKVVKEINTKLETYLIEVENKISNQEISNAEVSKANVGWHIEHILLTIDKIIDSLKKSEPANYKSSFNFTRLLVFTMNKLPRGRVKATKAVIPEEYNEKSLREHLYSTKLKLEELKTIDSNKYFNHPVFGNLKLNKTIKFLDIHTKHHLKIINDILKIKISRQNVNF